MSAWGDMMRRGAGEEIRAEDTISFDKPGPDYVVYDMREFNETLKEIKEQHKKLEKQMRKITGILKGKMYECMG